MPTLQLTTTDLSIQTWGCTDWQGDLIIYVEVITIIDPTNTVLGQQKSSCSYKS